jgi:hypothetical protein
MDVGVARVAETLAYEFEDLRGGAVAAVLCECVDEHPYDGPHFIEQAARARLAVLRGPQCPEQVARRDTLDVSLHDGELAEEVELTVRLIVAANDSDGALGQREIDDLLDVRPPVRPVRQRMPR